MKTLVKICGINSPNAMTAALEAEADFIGLVFHPSSPRFVEIEVAAYLAGYVPDSVKTVGLFVEPDDKTLTETLENVRIDMIQLHGMESPRRVADIKARFGLPVIKALPISSRDDLLDADDYASSADWLLFDAKGTADQPGGHGLPFDWALLKDFQSPLPWMLAGGLTPSNVAEAVALLRPPAVDVSSGVEASRGIKDPAKIRAFIEAARSL
ncbi:MAG: phosphoribosylanthranilate isomerase [Micavibrio aeruginosavorus]|uniref:N-(5'-phosphoribosyl)anthranilate isomerase n=1 Tax=Micavibrio aeruginosavorus TaxID=349221 RepID=A0A2W5N7U5_9BACT|nr:MAG: phosphoribosylanthranilate isomerase [Micavibrio aeruginosavorus]